MKDISRSFYNVARRQFLKGSGALASVILMPVPLSATPEDMQAVIYELFGNRQMKEGHIDLKLPPISENGYSVPISIDVESPMSEADHIRRIVILSPNNPLAEIAHFKLTPAAGRASISTRIRLGGTQFVTVIAETNKGELYVASKETVVTLAACVIL